MARVRSVIINARILFLSIATIILIILVGCKKENVDLEEVMDHSARDLLTSAAKKTAWPSDVRSRAKSALEKLDNGILDTEPILVQAIIDVVEPNNEPALFIIFFDENKDLRGLRIKERYTNSDRSTTTIEEDYPVFVNTLDTIVAAYVRFPIHIRDKDQRKDKCAWLEYANRNLDELIHLNIDERHRDSSDTRPQGIPFEKTPPIYISVPDPNRVDVEASIYDREGNESDSIDLIAGKYIKSEAH
jgi:hypothetical protein